MNEIQEYNDEPYLPDMTKTEMVRELEQTKQGLNILANFPEWKLAFELSRDFAKWSYAQPERPLLASWMDQTYRAIVSTSCNIAEGIGRGSIAQVCQYVRIGRGSAFEALTLLLAPPIPVPKEFVDKHQELIAQIDTTLIRLTQERIDLFTF